MCIYIHTYLTSMVFFYIISFFRLSILVLLGTLNFTAHSNSRPQSGLVPWSKLVHNWAQRRRLNESYLDGWPTRHMEDELMKDGRWQIGHKSRNGTWFRDRDMFKKGFELRRQKQLVQLYCPAWNITTFMPPEPQPNSFKRCRDRVITLAWRVSLPGVFWPFSCIHSQLWTFALGRGALNFRGFKLSQNVVFVASRIHIALASLVTVNF